VYQGGGRRKKEKKIKKFKKVSVLKSRRFWNRHGKNRSILREPQKKGVAGV
jgi:hypothetical protein